jgi:hypothetical protein
VKAVCVYGVPRFSCKTRIAEALRSASVLMAPAGEFAFVLFDRRCRSA